jgi:hypothetical protein
MREEIVRKLASNAGVEVNEMRKALKSAKNHGQSVNLGCPPGMVQNFMME